MCNVWTTYGGGSQDLIYRIYVVELSLSLYMIGL